MENKYINIEKKYIVTYDVIDEIICLIRADIHKMRYEMNVLECNIRVSLPYFIKQLIRRKIETEYLYITGEIFKQFFGVEIVSGYNNQICVFDEIADFNSPMLKPINLLKDENGFLKISR